MSSFTGLSEAISAKGLFSSFYSDRGSHYFVTPEAGGKVDRDNLTQVGRALKQLMIEHTAAYSPQARGRSERMFGTLQNRLPQELRVAGVKTIEEANRYLGQTYLAGHRREGRTRSLRHRGTRRYTCQRAQRLSRRVRQDAPSLACPCS